MTPPLPSLARRAAVLVSLALAASGKERGCTETGGAVVTLQCCASAPDFPNMCVTGACGCDPRYSVLRQVCQCPGNECFDRTGCVHR